MINRSYFTSEETQKKLNIVKQKIAAENTLLGDDYIITWDMVFSKMANQYLQTTTADIAEKAKEMKNNESESKIKLSELQEQIEKYFKEQNNNIEELIGTIVKQSNNTEILQKLQSVERQNENISLDIKSIQTFNISMNDDYKELTNSIKSLLTTIGDMSNALSQKITQKIKQQIGIAVSFIMHYIIRDNNLHLKKTPIDEAVKEVNKVVNSYKNLYDSSEQYSSGDIEKIFDKYSMKEQLK